MSRIYVHPVQCIFIFCTAEMKQHLARYVTFVVYGVLRSHNGEAGCYNDSAWDSLLNASSPALIAICWYRVGLPGSSLKVRFLAEDVSNAMEANIAHTGRPLPASSSHICRMSRFRCTLRNSLRWAESTTVFPCASITVIRPFGR